MESIWSMDVVVPFSSILAAVLISTAGVIFGRLKLALIVQFGFLVYWGRLWDITIFSDSASWLSGQTLLISGVCFILLVFAVLGLTVHRE
ncbi:MAG TPA: hypothetical protein PLO63_06160 [Syntrophales bacterium]|nr:hypothetical protein [Syntrophales bacterium]